MSGQQNILFCKDLFLTGQKLTLGGWDNILGKFQDLPWPHLRSGRGPEILGPLPDVGETCWSGPGPETLVSHECRAL